MDLANLKFKVETGELELAIKKVKQLTETTKELTKTSSELLKADRLAAEVSLAQAKAQLQLINVQIKQVELDKRSIDLKKKKANLDVAEANANLKKAQAEEKQVSAKVKASKLEEKLNKTSENSVKSKKEQVSASDLLSRKLEQLASKTSFVVQGNSRTESSFLALIKSLGATEDQMKKVTDLFEIQRKVIGGDPFDKSASAAQKLGRELGVLSQYMKDYSNGTGLTRNQAKELAREIERLTQLGKQQNLTSEQTSAIIDRETKAYIENAKALNQLERELRDKTRAATDSIKAEEARARALEKVSVFESRMSSRGSLTKGSVMNGELLPKSVITNLVNYEQMLNKAGVTGEAFNTKMEKMKNTLVRTEQIRGITSSFGDMTSSILKASIAMVGISSAFDAFSQYFVISDQMKNLEARMNAVGQGTANFNRDFAKLIEISNSTGASLESTGTIFTRLLPVMENFGKGSQDALKITSNLSAILRVSGASASEASSALLQISQAFAKGKLDGDEFRSVAENMPEVLRLLEAQTGKTRGELYLMSEQGKITAKLLSDTLGQDIDKLNKQLEQMPLTVGVANNALANSFKVLIQKFDEATGLSEMVAKGIKSIADAMSSLAKNDSAITLMKGLVGAMAGVAAAGAAVLTIKGITLAVTGLGSALGFLGLALTGPVGILLGIAGVAGAATVMMNRTNPIKEMTNDIDSLSRKLKSLEGQMSSGFVYTGRNQKKTLSPAELKVIQSEIEQTKRQLEVARGKLSAEQAKSNTGKIETAKASTIRNFTEGQATAFANTAEYTKLAADFGENKVEELKKKLYSLGDFVAAQNNIIDTEFKTAIQGVAKDSKEYQDAVNKATADRMRIARVARDAGLKLQKDIEAQEKKNSGSPNRKRLTPLDFEEGNASNIKERFDAEIKLAKKQNENILDILQDRYDLGLISTEEYYSNYFSKIKEGNDSIIGLESEKVSKSILEYNRLIAEAGVALEDFKVKNKGVADYQDRVSEATEKYNERISKLNDEKKTLIETSRAFVEGKLDDYYKKMAESVNDLAKRIYSLNQSYKNFFEQESLRKQVSAEETALQDQIRSSTELQAVGLKAEFEERSRILAKLNEFKIAQEEINARKAAYEKTVSESQDTAKITEAKQGLELVNAQYEVLKANIERANELLVNSPVEARLKAMQEAQKQAYAEFVDKLGDGVMIGLRKGAKAGAKSIRDTILEELQKPITVFVKAVVSDLMGSTQGKSGNALGGIFDTVSNLFGGTGSGSSMVSTFANIFSSAGSMFGSEALSSFAAGMKGATLAPGLAGPTTAGAGGAMGLGASAATAVPYVAAAYAAYKISSGLYDQGYNMKNTDNYGALGQATKIFGDFGALNVQKTIHKGLTKLGISDKMAGLLSGSTVTSALFGQQKKKITATGIEGTFGGEDFTGFGFNEWKKKGGLFRKTKKGRDTFGLDSEFTDDLGEQFVKLKDSVKSTAEILGLSTNSIDSYQKSIKIYFKSQDEMSNQLIEQFKVMSDELAVRLVPNISEFALNGERLGDTLIRLATNLSDVNVLLGLTRNTLFESSIAGADFATKLADSFGGLDKMKEKVSSYYEKYFTEEEKRVDNISSVTKVITGIGLEVPKTIEGFKSLVSSLDLTTDSGRSAYAALLNISPVFYEIGESVEKLKESSVGIKDTIKNIALGDASPEKKFEQQLADFNALIVEATNATGSERLTLAGQVNSALEPLIKSAKDVYATGSDFFSIQNEIFNKANVFADAISGVDVSQYQEKSLAQFMDMNGNLLAIANSSALTVQELKTLLTAMQTSGSIPKFAKGGVFTNSVVSKPTNFNVAQMGENGSEAIMPLSRSSDGSLGVSGTVSVNNTEVVEGLKENNKHLSALVRLQQSANQRLIEELELVKEKLESIESTSKLQALNS